MGDKKGQAPLASLAAYRYLIMGTIGGTFILLGIGFLYMMTDFEHARIVLVATRSRRNIHSSCGIRIYYCGDLYGLALFPLHMWLPNIYTHAPNVVSAFVFNRNQGVILCAVKSHVYIVRCCSCSPSHTVKGYCRANGIDCHILSSINVKQRNIKKLLAFYR